MVQDSFWDHHRASEIQPSIKIHGTSLAQNRLNIGLAINLATEIKEIRVHCFMAALLVFAITLLVAVFLSELAQRSVLSTAVLFLLAGFIAGLGGLGWISVRPSDPVVAEFSKLALFSVLFTDGMRVSVDDLRSAWTLPGRALLLGLPINLFFIAVLARWIVELTWDEAFLLGAVLSPTDPVFAAAIVGRREIPGRIRHLLNVESGLNDGLALPFVLIFLARASGQSADGFLLGSQVVLGIALGIVVPLVLFLERTPFFFGSRAIRVVRCVCGRLAVARFDIADSCK